MKKIIFFVLVCFTFISAKAQLTNTKWKATLYIPDSKDIIFDFRTDTVEAFSIEDSESLETMLYTVKDTILTLKKITGQSECDDTVVGKYKFEMKDDGMYVTMIEDNCTDRANALNNNQKWTKLE
jgi:hypothetical protein